MLNPTVGQLESKIDYADRNALAPYNDGRMWWLVTDQDTSLAEVAHAAIHNPQKVIDLHGEGKVQCYRSLDQVRGKDFYCIYFVDAYWLKPYNKKTNAVLGGAHVQPQSTDAVLGGADVQPQPTDAVLGGVDENSR